MKKWEFEWLKKKSTSRYCLSCDLDTVIPFCRDIFNLKDAVPISSERMLLLTKCCQLRRYWPVLRTPNTPNGIWCYCSPRGGPRFVMDDFREKTRYCFFLNISSGELEYSEIIVPTKSKKKTKRERKRKKETQNFVEEIPMRKLKHLDFGRRSGKRVCRINSRFFAATGAGGVQIFDSSSLQFSHETTVLGSRARMNIFHRRLIRLSKKYYATCANDYEIYIWDIENPNCHHIFQKSGQRKIETLCKLNHLLFAASKDRVRVYDWKNQVFINTLFVQTESPISALGVYVHSRRGYIVSSSKIQFSRKYIDGQMFSLHHLFCVQNVEEKNVDCIEGYRYVIRYGVKDDAIKFSERIKKRVERNRHNAFFHSSKVSHVICISKRHWIFCQNGSTRHPLTFHLYDSSSNRVIERWNMSENGGHISNLHWIKEKKRFVVTTQKGQVKIFSLFNRKRIVNELSVRDMKERLEFINFQYFDEDGNSLFDFCISLDNCRIDVSKWFLL